MVSFNLLKLLDVSPLSFANTVLATIILAVVASVLILGLLLRTGAAWKLAMDIPNARSLHTRPTPRVGGWAVTPVSVLSILFVARSLWPLAALAALLGLVSQIDDRRGLSARYRFAAHLISAIALVLVAPPLYQWWLAVPMVFLLVWVSNLYNFMDGANGLAGGMAVFGFAGYALMAGVTHPEISLAAAGIAAAAAGFLAFNFPNAKVFLGDAGSVPIGFLAGGMGYWGWCTGAWPFWFPAFVFAPFILDATVTLLKRLVRGERFWEAHRQHYYQRMIGMAGGHTPVVLRWYATMMCGIALAMASTHLLGLWPEVMLAGWLLFLALLGWNVDRRWRRKPAY
jgi:UDP-N-acetylmuramyl pentapeptide phosphotransferase/UDP-N-acetylglucosamine-1-phosphate transferase